jgi:hypothetical protein
MTKIEYAGTTKFTRFTNGAVTLETKESNYVGGEALSYTIYVGPGGKSDARLQLSAENFAALADLITHLRVTA